jgi:hypothetical protein
VNQIINVVSFGITDITDIDLLDKQYELFKKYCKNKINFIVIPGREHNKEHINNIHSLQQILNKKYEYFIPKSLLPNSAALEHPSQLPALSLNDFFGECAPGKYFTVHLDCLPIKQFNLNDWIEDKPMFVIDNKREHIIYAWDNMFFVNTNIIPSKDINFNSAMIENVICDTGAETHTLIKKYEHNKYYNTIKYLNCIETILNCDISEHNKEILLKNYFLQLETTQKFENAHWSELFLNDTFFHYRSFSGWHRNDEYTLTKRKERKDLLLQL